MQQVISKCNRLLFRALLAHIWQATIIYYVVVYESSIFTKFHNNCCFLSLYANRGNSVHIFFPKIDLPYSYKNFFDKTMSYTRCDLVAVWLYPCLIIVKGHFSRVYGIKRVWRLRDQIDLIVWYPLFNKILRARKKFSISIHNLILCYDSA